MPRKTSIIDILLASPSDVIIERDLISTTVQEWNALYGESRNVNFNLIRYETDVAPNFGDYPQAVVNDQVGDKYDVLIAIFWNRIGTETPAAASGSVEEYERALARLKDGDDVHIALYFKEANVAPDKIDLEQLAKLREFRAGIPSAGGLTSTFSDDEALRYSINLLLDRLARRFGDNGAVLPAEENSQSDRAFADQSGEIACVDDDEPGLLDLLDSIEEHSTATTSIINEISSRFDRLGELTEVNTEEINAKRSYGEVSRQDMRRIIESQVINMDELSAYIEDEKEEFFLHSNSMADDFRDMIKIFEDFDTDKEEIDGLRTNVEYLIEKMSGGIAATERFAESVEGLQRMTKDFNKSKRRLSTNLRDFAGGMNHGQETFKIVLDELRKL